MGESERYLWGFLPCLDRGWGEEAWRWGGPFEYRARAVESPGGVEVLEGCGRLAAGALDHLRGTSSGEQWIGTELEHEVVFRYHRDRSLEAWGPGSELLTSLTTARRVVVRFVAHLWVDPEGGLSRQSRCRVTGWRYL